MVPLGLYRTVKVNLNDYKPDDQAAQLKFRNLDHQIPTNYKEFNYVVTNPDGDNTKLEKTDKVFVLAKHDPGDPDQWDDYDGANQNMFDQNQNRLMQDIGNMMLKPPKGAKAKTKKEQKMMAELKGTQYQEKVPQLAMQMQGVAVAQEDDLADQKPDLQQTFSSKAQQQKFDQNMIELL